MATTVDVDEAKRNLPELLALAKAGGEVFISEGDAVVRLSVVAQPRANKARVAGLHAGAIWVSKDFDEELPEEFWAGTS